MVSQSIDLPGNALVALTRESLLAIRDAMFRDIGPNAAAVLQDAGYAGGPALFDAFSQWLASRGGPAPEALAAAEFGSRATEFFRLHPAKISSESTNASRHSSTEYC